MTRPMQFLGTATLTTLATFVYYSAFAALAGATAITAQAVLARAGAAIVVGTFLTVRARQRNEQDVAAAATEGFVLGIIVVVCNSLFGSDFDARELAIRTAGILTGVPALAALSQVLARHGRAVEKGTTPNAS